MKNSWRLLINFICVVGLFSSCNPGKAAVQQDTDTLQPADGNALSPEEQEKLRIEEENVFDETPPG